MIDSTTSRTASVLSAADTADARRASGVSTPTAAARMPARASAPRLQSAGGPRRLLPQ